METAHGEECTKEGEEDSNGDTGTDTTGSSVGKLATRGACCRRSRRRGRGRGSSVVSIDLGVGVVIGSSETHATLVAGEVEGVLVRRDLEGFGVVAAHEVLGLDEGGLVNQGDIGTLVVVALGALSVKLVDDEHGGVVTSVQAERLEVGAAGAVVAGGDVGYSVHTVGRELVETGGLGALGPEDGHVVDVATLKEGDLAADQGVLGTGLGGGSFATGSLISAVSEEASTAGRERELNRRLCELLCIVSGDGLVLYSR